MSRQNEIPSKAGLPTPTLALIPLWDLCNHSNGNITTFFNVDNSTCDCYAQRNFSVHEEFTIFYGPRTNSDLLLQQGFVYMENEHDNYPIRLGEDIKLSTSSYCRLLYTYRFEFNGRGDDKGYENPSTQGIGFTDVRVVHYTNASNRGL